VPLQVEIQVRKIYCVNRAIPNLPMKFEDAARSEIEIEKVEHVYCFKLCELSAFCLMNNATLCSSFVLPVVSTILSYDLIIAMIEGWTTTEHYSCWARYAMEL